MRTFLALSALLSLAACESKMTEAPAAEAAKKAEPAPAAPAAATGGSKGTDPAAVVATWNGGQLTYADVEKDVKSQLIKLEVDYLTNRYQTESQATEQAVMKAVLEAEAKAKGAADVDALLKVEVEDKVPAPTEDEVRAHYNVLQRNLRGAPYEEVADRVRQDLLRRKQGERFGAYFEELKSRYGVKTTLPFPDMPRIPISVDDDPSKGNANASITIVQFAEFQCPYCGQADKVVEQVLKEYDGKVKMVFRDYPLGFHDRAVPAAVAANCAGEQGKYWEMHTLLMSNQRALEETDLVAHATTLQLDLGKWNTCRQDPKQAAEVQKDFEDGSAAGVSGTPAFFINGIFLSGALPIEEFRSVIDRELAKG